MPENNELKACLTRICSHCNKEFHVNECCDDPLSITTSIMNCPYCKNRNDIWVKYIKDVSRPAVPDACKYGVIQESSGWHIMLGESPRNIHWVARTLNEQDGTITSLIAQVQSQAGTIAELEVCGITLKAQNRIRDFIVKFTECDDTCIDGSGCDSGDPVDLTLAEIQQGLCFVMNKSDEMASELLLMAKLSDRDYKFDKCEDLVKAMEIKNKYMKGGN